MASGNEKLQIDITAKDNASKVVDGVQKRVDKLETDPIELTVEAKVQGVIDGFDKITAEAKATTAAAEALGRALGPELAAKADTTAIVQDLQRAGLTADEVKANVDQLGAKLREVADADVGGKLGASLGTARGKLDEMRGSADSSKSVLANMVGNSVQDLGALTGVAGSAGVAIGQMGEYMADARASGEGLGSILKSFAGVAGPIAALAVATEIFSAVMKGISERSKVAEENQEAWTEALLDGGDAASNFADHLRDTGKVMAAVGDDKGYADVTDGWVEAATKFGAIGLTVNAVAKTFGIFGQKTQDISTTLSEAGFTAQTWAAAIQEGAPAIGKLQVAMQQANVSADDQKVIMEALIDAQADYATSKQKAAFVEAFFGKKVDDSAESLKASKKAFDDAADGLQEWADRTARAISRAHEMQQIMAGSDWGKAAVNGAVEAMSAYTEEQFGLVNINAAAEESFDNLRESVKENGKSFDVTTEKGRANNEALQDVAKTLDTKLAAAYASADGDMGKFKESAGKLAEETLTRLQKELGLSDEQTRTLGESLGLTEGDYEARFKLSGAAEAQAKLDLLNVALDDFDDPVARQAYMDAVVQGDYELALQIARTMAAGDKSVRYDVYTRYHTSGDRGSSGLTPPELTSINSVNSVPSAMAGGLTINFNGDITPGSEEQMRRFASELAAQIHAGKR